MKKVSEVVFGYEPDALFAQTGNHRQKPKLKGLAILATLLLLLNATPVCAERILMIGDSWSWPVAPELQTVLQENGHADIIVEAAPTRGTAAILHSQAVLDDISTWLDERPDVTFVQLSIGANDWEAWGWAEGSWSSEYENSQIDQYIINPVNVVVDHILSLRPSIQILWSSYDFPRPYEREFRNPGTPFGVNTFLLKMSSRIEQFAATKPGLSFVDINGTLQVTYGFDGVQHTEFDPRIVIPPGSPSLPSRYYPSPLEPFLPNDIWHLVPDGYKALAQAQYDGYYSTALTASGFEMNAGLNDAWYNPETDGQGYFITVFPDLNTVSLAWFTYDSEPSADDVTAKLGDPGHRWLTAVGPIDGNQAIMEIEMTSGGLFDTVSEITRTDPPGSDGTILLTFDNCNSGTVEYDIPSINRQGIVPIQRVASDNIVTCEALSTD